MKKKYIGIVPLLCMTISLFGATIRIYNKLNNDTITVTAITPQKKMVEQIEPMNSVMFNSWFNGITSFEWEVKGSKWVAPLEMRALQTEGRLYIQPGGKYIFKPCLPCRESVGNATLVSMPKAPVNVATINGSSTIPTPPPLPPAKAKMNQMNPSNDLSKEIQQGKQLRPTKYSPKPVDQRAEHLKEIREKRLKTVHDKALKAKPNTTRDKLLEDIQKGTPLKKTSTAAREKSKHEMIDPLSKAIDARRQQLKEIEKSMPEDETLWQD